MPATIQKVSYAPESLFSSEYPVLSLGGTLAAGNNLAKLTPVVRTAAGLWEVADETEAATGILMEAVDAASADAKCSVYVSGCFDTDSVNFDADFTTLAAKQASLLAPLFTKPKNAI